MNNNFTIRLATREDSNLIFDFIMKLAVYEKMKDDVVATPKTIEKTLFDNHEAEVIIAEESNNPIGFALFFTTYSTFLGQSNMYLEDIFIDEDKRGKGYGKAMFTYLATLAHERNYKRLEWVCLDWNTSSITFYKNLGAKPLDEWITFRLDEEAIKKVAKKDN